MAIYEFKKFYSLKEASEFLGITYPLCYKRIVVENVIPYYDYGNDNQRVIKIAKKDLEEYQKSKLVVRKEI